MRPHFDEVGSLAVYRPVSLDKRDDEMDAQRFERGGGGMFARLERADKVGNGRLDTGADGRDRIGVRGHGRVPH